MNTAAHHEHLQKHEDMLAGIADAQLQTSIPISNHQRTWHSEQWSHEVPEQDQVDPARCRGACWGARRRVGVMQVDG